MEKKILVGVGVLIFNDENKILLGKRKNSHGDGTWAPPGGHVEFGESPEECAARETLEEAGIRLKNLKRMSFVYNASGLMNNKHYITLFVAGKLSQGIPKVMEPHKCDTWEWFSPDTLPKPLFEPFEDAVTRGMLERALFEIKDPLKTSIQYQSQAQ